VPALSFGAGTFGGSGPLFGAWGDTDAKEARRLVGICLEAGVTLFDTADVYSNGASEEVLGEALKGRRDQVLISTKTALPMGDAANDAGTSRSRLIRTVEDALRRLGTDYIDLLQLHAFDAGTPIEEVLSSLDDLVRAGKVRYVGVSNFSGWQVKKSLTIAEKKGLAALCRPSGLLLPRRPRLRMGSDAARSRPGRWRTDLESARLGTAYRQDSPRPEAARRKSSAPDGRIRPAL
jgi:aryl-alcohol dehydrogenase-like predicted oxidoreductase